MNGTTISATRAIAGIPPKMMTAERIARTMPVPSFGAPKAPSIASAIELA